MDDIAQRLRVSKVTVSKALRGHPDISAETTAKIKKLARKWGYIPNYPARNLASNHSKTIGVIVPKIAHYFFSPVIEAMYDVAFENGYELILTVSQESVQREQKHVETLLSMRVDGIIVSVTQETRDGSIFQRAKQRGVPLTFMDRVMDDEGFNKIVADDFGGAFTATEQAIRVGCRTIAHLSGNRYLSIARNRLAGYKAALKKHEIPVSEDRILFSGLSDDDGYAGFQSLYESKRMPECIFCVTYPVALGVCRAARERGMRIPEDIDIITFGSSTLNRFQSPSMSYIEQPTTELGRKALELTIDTIRTTNDFVPQTITLPTRLVLRDTCVRSRQHGQKAGVGLTKKVGMQA
jgi:LacI family transcriptional regulator